MSSALSGFGVSAPFLTQKNNGVKLSRGTFQPMRSTYRNSNGSKAITSEGRDNLDHLQRSARSQQPQPNKRTPQTTPIGLWDSFPSARTVQQMMETMDRLIEDPLAYNTVWATPYARGEDLNNGYRRRGRTPWEIKEREKEYKLRFDMPGMTKSDVKLWVEEKMLVVKAEKVSKKREGSENGGEEEEEEWSAESYGKYSSRIALPENVEFEKIKAEVRDGVLYITIPKASVTPKVLDINVQ